MPKNNLDDQYIEIHNRLADQFETSPRIIRTIRSMFGEGKTREQIIHFAQKKIASSRHYKSRSIYIDPLKHSRKKSRRHYQALLAALKRFSDDDLKTINVPLEEVQ